MWAVAHLHTHVEGLETLEHLELRAALAPNLDVHHLLATTANRVHEDA